MKDKIKMWIFTKCLQIAKYIQPYKFNKCYVGINSEIDMTAIVPPDDKEHIYSFTFSVSIKKPDVNKTLVFVDMNGYVDGIPAKDIFHILFK